MSTVERKLHEEHKSSYINIFALYAVHKQVLAKMETQKLKPERFQHAKLLCEEIWKTNKAEAKQLYQLHQSKCGKHQQHSSIFNVLQFSIISQSISDKSIVT